MSTSHRHPESLKVIEPAAPQQVQEISSATPRTPTVSSTATLGSSWKRKDTSCPQGTPELAEHLFRDFLNDLNNLVRNDQDSPPQMFEEWSMINDELCTCSPSLHSYPAPNNRPSFELKRHARTPFSCPVFDFPCHCPRLVEYSIFRVAKSRREWNHKMITKTPNHRRLMNTTQFRACQNICRALLIGPRIEPWERQPLRTSQKLPIIAD